MITLGGWLAVSGVPAWAQDAALQAEGTKGTDAMIERFLMEGTEIQGTLEKPHVVYVVPWKDVPSLGQGDLVLRRSFREEILEPVDRSRFQRQLSNSTANGQGGNLK
jgi:hypothetical protein